MQYLNSSIIHAAVYDSAKQSLLYVGNTGLFLQKYNSPSSSLVDTIGIYNGIDVQRCNGTTDSNKYVMMATADEVFVYDIESKSNSTYKVKGFPSKKISGLITLGTPCCNICRNSSNLLYRCTDTGSPTSQPTTHSPSTTLVPTQTPTSNPTALTSSLTTSTMQGRHQTLAWEKQTRAMIHSSRVPGNFVRNEIALSNGDPRRRTISLLEKDDPQNTGSKDNAVMKGTKTTQGLSALDKGTQEVVQDIITDDFITRGDLASVALSEAPTLSNKNIQEEGEGRGVEGQKSTSGNDDKDEENSTELRGDVTTTGDDEDLREFLKEIGLQQYYDKMCKRGWTLNRLLNSHDGTPKSIEQFKTKMGHDFQMSLRERIHLTTSIKNKRLQLYQEGYNTNDGTATHT
ncbi:hypothetical protein RFI_03458 [Reticulomyxa filosa]|uniref:Uncharacterized protein n=1 Tax=Reticulomyxa filosa TaxID=46433 RepID=X6P521_RETFI|nr:hypothetical protein RFI_03458 [Reticulomyxa filosa]|eukprot:ETO33645.1 hypothetical protein RFI_03458 [Reticulomyxa filosa]